MLSLLPIAAGYHAAHYLTQLLAGLRYALAALDRAAPPTTSPSAFSPTPPASG